MITVITPTIPGREDFLAECRASVAAQSVPADHAVGLDRKKEGPCKVRNRLIDEADTEWLAFLDDDDLLYPQHLELLSAVDADVVYSLFDIAIAEGCSPENVPPHFCPIRRNIVDRLSAANFIPITVLARRSLVVAVGGFPDVPWSEDWELWKLLRSVHARFACVHERTWQYRFHGQNRSRT